MLVVAAGEQDVLPAWGLLLAWDRTQEKGTEHVIWLFLLPFPSPSRPDAWRLPRKTDPT